MSAFTGGSRRQPLYFSTAWITVEINFGLTSACQARAHGEVSHGICHRRGAAGRFPRRDVLAIVSF